MKFGICTSYDSIEIAQGLGFDCIECCASVIASYGDDKFNVMCERLLCSDLTCESANGLFPQEIKLLGDIADEKLINEYLNRTFERLSRLGVKTAVFGSGRSREVPQGYDKGRAYEQLIKLCRKMADISSAYGITSAVEPLNRGETNIINTQLEGLKLVCDVSSPYFKVICDLYHLKHENEGTAELEKCKGVLAHVHIANPITRRAPEENDCYDYKGFVSTLRKTGYDGIISVESVSGINELKPIEWLRKLLSQRKSV